MTKGRNELNQDSRNLFHFSIDLFLEFLMQTLKFFGVLSREKPAETSPNSGDYDEGNHESKDISFLEGLQDKLEGRLADAAFLHSAILRQTV